MEISRMEEEVRKSEEEITRIIKVKEKSALKPLDISSLATKVVDLYPEGTTDGEGRLKDDFIEIGKEESSRLERVPAKVYILKTVRHKVISKSDMEKYPEERQILIHPLPLVPVSKCMAGASVLTDIIIGKFMYHLPFYRLIQQYRESGISISESTMCGWYEMAVEKLKLLYSLLKQKILSSEYIQVDVSVISVMDNEKHKAKRGMSSAYATASRGTSCPIMTVAAFLVVSYGEGRNSHDSAEHLVVYVAVLMFHQLSAGESGVGLLDHAAIFMQELNIFLCPRCGSNSSAYSSIRPNRGLQFGLPNLICEGKIHIDIKKQQIRNALCIN